MGGLHVVGTEHHDARRVDNQLRGRSGRQGDPGSSQFYVSLEDELMQRFGGERIKSFMGWTGLEDDVPIENKLITKSIGTAQVKVEGYHFDIRKHLLNYDDVLNTQRGIIYSDRERILKGDNLRERILGMLGREFEDIVSKRLASRHNDDWEVTGFLNDLALICPLPPELDDVDKVYALRKEDIQRILAEHAEAVYDGREKQLGEEQMRVLERLLLLRSIDLHWVNHLTAMENLRTGIGLQAVGQRDPLVMYRSEGHKTFQELLARMQDDVAHSLFHVTVTQQPPNGQRRSNGATQGQSDAVGQRPGPGPRGCIRRQGRPERPVSRAGAAASTSGAAAGPRRGGNPSPHFNIHSNSLRLGWFPMGVALRVSLHILLFLVAIFVFYLGLGIGLAWPGVTVAGVTLSGPTAGTILWITQRESSALGNLVWILRASSRARE